MNTNRLVRRGWFPHPVLSLLLAASWLALSHSLALVHLLSAAVIGWAVPRLIASFLGPVQPIHWPSAWRLGAVVLWDIVLSNITVARLVLGPMSRPQPAWVVVPLDSDHPWVNALFASIITTTPGTVSAVIDEAGARILVHALDCADAAAMARDMKARYETPLLRVFGAENRSHP
jgi:multicomponent K+:H+ antiporter subunit E